MVVVKLPKSGVNFRSIGDILTLSDVINHQEVQRLVAVAFSESEEEQLSKFIAEQITYDTVLGNKIRSLIDALVSKVEVLRSVPVYRPVESDIDQRRSLRSYFIQMVARVAETPISILDLGAGKCQLLQQLAKKMLQTRMTFDFQYFGIDKDFSKLHNKGKHTTSVASELSSYGYDVEEITKEVNFNSPDFVSLVKQMCIEKSITHVVSYNALQYIHPDSLRELVEWFAENDIVIYGIVPSHDYAIGSDRVMVSPYEEAGTPRLIVYDQGSEYHEYLYLRQAYDEIFTVVRTGLEYWCSTKRKMVVSHHELSKTLFVARYPDSIVHLPPFEIVPEPLGWSSYEDFPSAARPFLETHLNLFHKLPSRIRPKKNGFLVKMYGHVAVQRDGFCYRTSNPLPIYGYGELIPFENDWRIVPLSFIQVGQWKMFGMQQLIASKVMLKGISSLVYEKELMTIRVKELEGLVMVPSSSFSEYSEEVYLKPYLVQDFTEIPLYYRTYEHEYLSYDATATSHEVVVDIEAKKLYFIRPRPRKKPNSDALIREGYSFYMINRQRIRDFYIQIVGEFPKSIDYAESLRECDFSRAYMKNRSSFSKHVKVDLNQMFDDECLLLRC